MPMTSTKNFRLSSGFGVSISMWPRWAMSKIGSGVIASLLKCTPAWGLVVRDARQCRAPHHEGLRPHPEEARSAVSKDEATERALNQRARHIVEQFVDGIGARNQPLLGSVGNDQFQRAAHLVGGEMRRGRYA